MPYGRAVEVCAAPDPKKQLPIHNIAEHDEVSEIILPDLIGFESPINQESPLSDDDKRELDYEKDADPFIVSNVSLF